MAEKRGAFDWKNHESVYVMRLFVTGASPNSARAISNLKKICEEYLKDSYELEIVDVYQHPIVAMNEQLIALPMLVKISPGMERRLIGDMSDKQKVLKGLEIIR
jgi:circadian clock protein KaiB